MDNKKIALVLGGGGIKGLAHIGVLQVLQRHGIVPSLFVGTSVGALIAAMAAGGMSPQEIRQVGLSLRRSDLLDYDWLRLLWRRHRTRSMYKGKALHDFVRRTLPEDRFDRIGTPLYITSVDLSSAQEVIWGMPGFTEIPIHDAVIASCSIPGIYPPKKIGRFHFVDGSLTDPLPVKVAVYHKADVILAVYLETKSDEDHGAVQAGVGAILLKSQSVISRTLMQHDLHCFTTAPIVLIRPRVAERGMFDLRDAPGILKAGEEAAEEALRTSPLTRVLMASPPALPSGP